MSDTIESFKRMLLKPFGFNKAIYDFAKRLDERVTALEEESE